MNKKVKGKTNSNFLILVLIIIAVFFAGSIWGKKSALKDKVAGVKTEVKDENTVEFTPESRKKPNLKFFVMSHCPFGNQAEAGLKPVAELLGNKVEWEPHYIFDKRTDKQLQQMCQSEVYSEELCQQYVSQGYFPDSKACQERLYSSEDECFEKKSSDCLASAEGSYYCSLHGKKELNQGIREICAWNLTDDKNKWWQFISLVNSNCPLEEIDSCWQAQAKEANIDENKVQECFNKKAIEILDKEIAITEQFNVSGSPSIFVNDKPYPPESAYDREGKATMKIGGEIFQQEKYRSPEAFKQAVCAAFEKAPKECKTELSRESDLGSAGSCD